MVSRLGRRSASAAAASFLVFTAPVRAQTAPAPASSPAGSDIPLAPDSPLAPMTDLGVGWPDLTAQPGDPATDAAATDPAGAERRYTWRIDGLGGADSTLLQQRFADNSTLDANDRQPANAAQLERRAREDAALLTSLLRARGYYDAHVATRVEPGAKPLVVLATTPGARYTFGSVTLAGVAAAGDKAAGLTGAFGIAPGAPVDSDAVVAGEAKLRTAIGKQGFAFATVGEPAIVVDHATHTATIDVAVAPGAAKRFGHVVAEPGNRVFGADHVQEIARFRPGAPYDATALDDLRRALIQTSLVSAVDLKPVPGPTPDTVDIAVKLDPAPPRTIAAQLGYGTGEGATAEVDWTHRNLFPPEGALILRGVLGTQEQLGSVIFRRNNFDGRDRVLTFQLAAAHVNRTAYEARTFSLSGTLERQTNIFFQKAWVWSLGAELLASDERDSVEATGAPREGTYFIGALPTSLTYDGSDDLLDPTKGFRLGGRISPELSLRGAAFGYARTQLDASVYRTILPGVVLAGRTRLGTIVGAPRDAVAPSRRFYAGGGASVRGYGYQDVGPRDANNNPIGGRSITEFSAEARLRLFGSFGIVPFLDAGNIYISPLPKFTGLQYGTGVGVRYYSNFGPIRLDVGTPINPQAGDGRIAVYVSLGQAF
ncbi:MULTISPECIES: BamA/TamA family outer membrane protein [unclassified Sphingomonas]|uniref:autotransporter assembly complex protein TamA n=1 Tax=unclassified Sphingomonas TaxID=196159 RepID=UPI002269DF46|nr:MULTISPECIES: BamA/TamA family outer membrane protein [unclassified Sphingomonas]